MHSKSLNSARRWTRRTRPRGGRRGPETHTPLAVAHSLVFMGRVCSVGGTNIQLAGYILLDCSKSSRQCSLYYLKPYLHRFTLTCRKVITYYLPPIEARRGASVGRGGGVRGGRAWPTHARKARPQGHARAEPAAQVPWAAAQPMAVVRVCWTDGRPARRPRGVQGARLSSRRGLRVARRTRALGRHDGDHRRQKAARGSALLVPGDKKRVLTSPLVPSAPGARQSTPKAQRRDPTPPSTPGARVLDRDHGVGWVPPIQKAGWNGIRPRPDRYKDCPD